MPYTRFHVRAFLKYDESMEGNRFSQFARWTSRTMGTPLTFALVLVLCIAWVALSPIFDSRISSLEILILNIPSLITLLMVFLVQHTQNHHNDVVQVKLDELIRAMKGAHNTMLSLEELSPEELARVKEKYQVLAERVRQSSGGPTTDTSTPEIDPMPDKSEGGSHAA